MMAADAVTAARPTTPAAAGSEAASEAGSEAASDERVDILDVMEAMSTHFHEHHDAIVRWSWKLFCAKWARLTLQAATQQREKLLREREHEHRQRFEAFARDRQGWQAAALSGGW